MVAGLEIKAEKPPMLIVEIRRYRAVWPRVAVLKPEKYHGKRGKKGKDKKDWD